MAMLAGSCGGLPLLSFDSYMAQCDALKGKPVQVSGYLDDCRSYDCMLFANRAHARAFAKYIQAVRDLALDDSRSREGMRAAIDKLKPQTPIGIGWADDFNKKVARFEHGYVVISGTVDRASCTGEGGTDRSYGVMPTNIRAWMPSEGAPANTQ